MKKILCMLLAFAILGISASATECKTENWFVKYPKDGGRPTAMDGSELPNRYGALYMGAEDEKVIYLTFDAGYGNENVDSVLQTLADNDIKATFFILPGLTDYSFDTLTRMINDGHLIGNHSYSHKNMGNIHDINAFKKELTDAEEHFKNATGKDMAKIFRPPEGAFSEDTLRFCRELGYTPVFWSFAYADWDNSKQPDPTAAKEKILSCAHNGEIMLLHPTSATNAAVLDDVIKALKADGYRFDTVDALINN